jgi:ADP-ribose pyrophosphatase YjhB (NUDIX family)
MRFTRAGLLRAAAAGGVAVAGGSALATASEDMDAEILNLFLLLEQVQEAFYRDALETGRLDGELREFAATVRDQERGHVRFLQERLGDDAQAPPETGFGQALTTPERFRDAAIELEEAAIAVYIGQGPNLSRRTVGRVAGLVAVEARQAAWVRDLAGVSPAPRAADPARKPEAVVAALHRKGYLR